MWSSNLYSKTLNYIYPEYNPFWCYMGWWLYAAPIVTEPHHHHGTIDREEWPKREDAVWLNYDWRLDALMEGLGLPQLHDYRGSNHTASIRNFLERYPVGVVCRVNDGGRLFEVADSIALWDYARIVKELQLLDYAKASEVTQEKLEELEKQLKPELEHSSKNTGVKK